MWRGAHVQHSRIYRRLVRTARRVSSDSGGRRGGDAALLYLPAYGFTSPKEERTPNTRGQRWSFASAPRAAKRLLGIAALALIAAAVITLVQGALSALSTVLLIGGTLAGAWLCSGMGSMTRPDGHLSSWRS